MPPHPRRVFSGMGGLGCIKFGPQFPVVHIRIVNAKTFSQGFLDGTLSFVSFQKGALKCRDSQKGFETGAEFCESWVALLILEP